MRLAGKVVGSTDATWNRSENGALSDRFPGYSVQTVIAGVRITIFGNAQIERVADAETRF